MDSNMGFRATQKTGIRGIRKTEKEATYPIDRGWGEGCF